MDVIRRRRTMIETWVECRKLKPNEYREESIALLLATHWTWPGAKWLPWTRFRIPSLVSPRCLRPFGRHLQDGSTAQVTSTSRRCDQRSTQSVHGYTWDVTSGCASPWQDHWGHGLSPDTIVGNLAYAIHRDRNIIWGGRGGIQAGKMDQKRSGRFRQKEQR